MRRWDSLAIQSFKDCLFNQLPTTFSKKYIRRLSAADGSNTTGIQFTQKLFSFAFMNTLEDVSWKKTKYSVTLEVMHFIVSAAAQLVCLEDKAFKI